MKKETRSKKKRNEKLVGPTNCSLVNIEWNQLRKSSIGVESDLYCYRNSKSDSECKFLNS